MTEPSSVLMARAPVRADLAGGGSDAPPFSIEHGGNVVNVALRRYAHARLEIRPGSRRAIVASTHMNGEAAAETPRDLEFDGHLDLLKAIVRRMDPPWGCRLEVDADVRPGSGLGSSGAVGVACVHAFDAAMGVTRGAVETALLANDIERSNLGAAGGCQDSFPPAVGGLNLVTMHKGGGVSHRPLAISRATRYELERRLLIVYTGEAHLSGNIHEDIRTDYARPDSTTRDAMHQLARIAVEMAAALERGALEEFGALLSANWEQHQRLHASCTSERLESFYAAAREHTAGGKTCGAGGGGCILFLSRDGQRTRLESVCRELGGEVMRFAMDNEGMAAWPLGPNH